MLYLLNGAKSSLESPLLDNCIMHAKYVNYLKDQNNKNGRAKVLIDED